jgi:hypothetical protein
LATAGKQGIAIVATDRDGRTAVPYAALEAAYAGDFSNRNPQVMVSVGNASASLKLTDDQLEAFAAARHKRVQAATATLAKEIKVRLQKRDFDAARELAGRCIALGLDRDACGKLQTSVTNAVQANEERLERIEERRERQEEAQADRDAGAEAPMGTAKAGPASSPSNVHQAAAGGTQAQEMPSKLAGSVLGQLVKAADSCETLKATTRAWAKAQAPADMKADDLMTMVWALTAMSPDQIKPQYRKLSDMNIVKRNRAGRVQFDNAVKSALIQTVYLPAECRKQISETAINLLARCKAVAGFVEASKSLVRRPRLRHVRQHPNVPDQHLPGQPPTAWPQRSSSSPSPVGEPCTTRSRRRLDLIERAAQHTAGPTRRGRPCTSTGS